MGRLLTRDLNQDQTVVLRKQWASGIFPKRVDLIEWMSFHFVEITGLMNLRCENLKSTDFCITSFLVDVNPYEWELQILFNKTNAF